MMISVVYILQVMPLSLSNPFLFRSFQRLFTIYRPWIPLTFSPSVNQLYSSSPSVSFSSSFFSVDQDSKVVLFYNDVYEVQLPENHRFPMEKYKLVRKTLQHRVGNNPKVLFRTSPLATRDELQTTHCPIYIDNYITGNMTTKEIRRTGFPWSEAHVKRSLSSVGGTVQAMRTVVESNTIQASCHIAGGTHHAFYNYGEGFCIFSDIAVAANVALQSYSTVIKKILIIDLDVHQGNGNAVLFQNNPNVTTFSMHCKANYFSDKQQSTYDVELKPNMDDETYINTLQSWLPFLMETVQPDLIFYQAGVDIYHGDRLGKLNISLHGIKRRNKMVYDTVKSRGCKLVVTMGGGYPKDLNPSSKSFQEIIEAHSQVYIQCIDSMTIT